MTPSDRNALRAGLAGFGCAAVLFVLVAVVVLLVSSGTIGWPVPSAKATAATYVWEKEEGGTVPSTILSALNELNKRPGLIATNHEFGTTDGEGQVPDQYKIAEAQAKTHGIPLLVVQAGERVLTVVKNPQTVDDVLKAVP